MMRFNRVRANQSPLSFVQTVLVDGLCAHHVVVGEDFFFGRDRAGDLRLLRELGDYFGFSVEVVPTVVEGGDRVSSTRIRRALAEGDFHRAAALLGRPFSMQGRVFRGAQLGRTLGYPTANMKLAAAPSPLAGVFAVRSRILDRGGAGEWMDGVANLGRRPAMGGGDFLVEIHVFDAELDLYAKRLEVRFAGKIRDEADFSSVGALADQMRRDETEARRMLGERTINETG